MRARKCDVRFTVERGMLVRYVTLDDGREYVHRASLDSIEEVAWYAEENAKEGVTTGELWEALPNFPATQISVALDFLKDRGCVVTECRRNYPASNILFEDAMVEYYALAEK
jgi:hypothetical protein